MATRTIFGMRPRQITVPGMREPAPVRMAPRGMRRAPAESAMDRFERRALERAENKRRARIIRDEMKMKKEAHDLAMDKGGEELAQMHQKTRLGRRDLYAGGDHDRREELRQKIQDMVAARDLRSRELEQRGELGRGELDLGRDRLAAERAAQESLGQFRGDELDFKRKALTASNFLEGQKLEQAGRRIRMEGDLGQKQYQVELMKAKAMMAEATQRGDTNAVERMQAAIAMEAILPPNQKGRALQEMMGSMEGMGWVRDMEFQVDNKVGDELRGLVSPDRMGALMNDWYKNRNEKWSGDKLDNIIDFVETSTGASNPNVLRAVFDAMLNPQRKGSWEYLDEMGVFGFAPFSAQAKEQKFGSELLRNLRKRLIARRAAKKK